jgi:serine/threonine protein phosphatase PrpC
MGRLEGSRLMAARTDSAELRAAGATDTGRQRQKNEDRFHIDVDRGIFIVVDGIGGQAAGDTAADIAIASMRERLNRQTGDICDRLREAITIANNEIHRLASTRAEWRGMACVLTAAVVDGDRAVVGHVGDSRLYKLQGHQIEKVTPDHSPIGEREDAHELSEFEAMRHPRRNEVYRDVGSEPHDAADPDFAYVAEIALPPDAALLICSDGLTDLVPSDTIRHIVVSHRGSPQDVVRGLIKAANEAGGKDNVTAVFIERPMFFAAASLDRGGTQARRRHRWLVPFAIAGAAAAGLLVGMNVDALGWLNGGSVNVLGWPAGAIVVRPSESIMTAVSAAAPGTEVVVEPGEYRERLTLKDHVRILSRVSGAAVLRLPGVAAEGEAAVIATGVADAELAGFRIVGDASTPLGTGIMTRDGEVRLVDLEVTGASVSALDIGTGGSVALVGSRIHDNPGAAVSIRTGAAPRLSQNVFDRNATSERSAAAFVVEPDARPEWRRNVFQDLGPEAIGGTDELLRSSLVGENWFLGVRPAPAATRPPSRGGRGR